MAIERRVKPSARAQEELYQRRKPIMIGAAALVLALILGVAGWTIYGKVKDVSKSPADDTSVLSGTNSGLSPSTNSDMAASTLNVSFDGQWTDTNDVGVSIYLPGAFVAKSDDFVSYEVHTTEARTAAFGVMMADTALPSLENDPTVDPSTVLSLFSKELASDVGLVMYDANFSAAYDLSNYKLPNGSNALWVSGDMQTRLSKQPEGATTATESVMDFPLCGFIVMSSDIPIFVWGVADPNDSIATQNLESLMTECAAAYSERASSTYSVPVTE